MTLPLVSIVTPSLNSAAWITATIVSVLAQDYGRLEYIVMDGGSTDDTHAILRRFAERDTADDGAADRSQQLATIESSVLRIGTLHSGSPCPAVRMEWPCGALRF